MAFHSSYSFGPSHYVPTRMCHLLLALPLSSTPCFVPMSMCPRMSSGLRLLMAFFIEASNPWVKLDHVDNRCYESLSSKSKAGFWKCSNLLLHTRNWVPKLATKCTFYVAHLETLQSSIWQPHEKNPKNHMLAKILCGVHICSSILCLFQCVIIHQEVVHMRVLLLSTVHDLCSQVKLDESLVHTITSLG